MTLEEKLKSLKQRTLDAFADVPHPNGNIAPHECEECFEVRKAFRSKIWKTIDDKILEENFDKLPLFSSEAFYYFLPAYLIYSFENFDDNDVCEFTIYALSPNKDSLRDDFDYWKERFENFTDKQIEIICEFLTLVDEDIVGEFRSFERIRIDKLKKLKEMIDSTNKQKL